MPSVTGVAGGLRRVPRAEPCDSFSLRAGGRWLRVWPPTRVSRCAMSWATRRRPVPPASSGTSPIVTVGAGSRGHLVHVRAGRRRRSRSWPSSGCAAGPRSSPAALRFWRLILLAFALITVGYAWLAADMLAHCVDRVTGRTMPLPAAALAGLGFAVAMWAVARRADRRDRRPASGWRLLLDRTIAFLGCAHPALALRPGPDAHRRRAVEHAGDGPGRPGFPALDRRHHQGVVPQRRTGRPGRDAADRARSGSPPPRSPCSPSGSATPAASRRRRSSCRSPRSWPPWRSGAQWRSAWHRAAPPAGADSKLLPYLAIVAVAVPLLAVAARPAALVRPQRDPRRRAGQRADLDPAVPRRSGRTPGCCARSAASEERLQHEVTHDGLTGLANRALFRDRLAGALRTEDHVTVLLVDLDDFKTVNDSLGHDVGDRLLVSVARRAAGRGRRRRPAGPARRRRVRGAAHRRRRPDRRVRWRGALLDALGRPDRRGPAAGAGQHRHRHRPARAPPWTPCCGTPTSRCTRPSSAARRATSGTCPAWRSRCWRTSSSAASCAGRWTTTSSGCTTSR